MVNCWMMPSMSNFWNNYLIKNSRTTAKTVRQANDVLFCPTDAWHRAGGNYYPKLLGAVPFTPAALPSSESAPTTTVSPATATEPPKLSDSETWLAFKYAC